MAMECEQGDCNQDAEFILDCDECKNVFCCPDDLGKMIIAHTNACGLTLHVDGLQISAPHRLSRCSVCGGEGEHDWEVHSAEMRAIDDR